MINFSLFFLYNDKLDGWYPVGIHNSGQIYVNSAIFLYSAGFIFKDAKRLLKANFKLLAVNKIGVGVAVIGLMRELADLSYDSVKINYALASLEFLSLSSEIGVGASSLYCAVKI